MPLCVNCTDNQLPMPARLVQCVRWSPSTQLEAGREVELITAPTGDTVTSWLRAGAWYGGGGGGCGAGGSGCGGGGSIGEPGTTIRGGGEHNGDGELSWVGGEAASKGPGGASGGHTAAANNE